MNAGQWFNLSPTMTDALVYGAIRGHQGTVATNRRTEDALVNRGLITYDHNVADSDGDLRLYPVLTPLGWTTVWELCGIVRPANDPGRYSLPQAIEEAYTPSGQVTCETEEIMNAERLISQNGEDLTDAYSPQIACEPEVESRPTATVILFKPSGTYYTQDEWRIPPNAIGPSDMRHSPDFRRIDGGAVLVETQEPWGFPHLFPGVSA